MIEKTGDVFDTTASYIAHGCNTKGFMGAGIAAQVRDKFPETYKDYRNFCKFYEPRAGVYHAYRENGHVILNLFTQVHPGPDARYDAVFNSLYSFITTTLFNERAEEFGRVIAMPEIGCGIGGLQWPGVKQILLTLEFLFDVEFEVWHYAGA